MNRIPAKHIKEKKPIKQWVKLKKYKINLTVASVLTDITTLKKGGGQNICSLDVLKYIPFC